MSKKNYILVDVDGVLLDWHNSFSAWAYSKGYTNKEDCIYDVLNMFDKEKKDELAYEFAGNDNFEHIPVFKDAGKYVPMLKNMGYNFIAITSSPSDLRSHNLRLKNLQYHFGKDSFRDEDLFCVGVNSTKLSIIKQYCDKCCLWVEDNLENVLLGASCGIPSVVMDASYNRVDKFHYPRFYNWHGIYKMIHAFNPEH